MKVLVLDSNPGVHVSVPALRREFPDATFFEPASEQETLAVCADCDVLVTMAQLPTEQLIRAMPKLGFVFSLTTGVDHLWTLTSLPPNVRITNARGIHGPQMAELTFLYMLGLGRNAKKIERNQHSKVWERWPQPLLSGKTAVLVGLGAIAEELALRCKAFGMTVIGVSDARSEFPHCDRIVRRTALKEAVAQGDFVVVLVPLDDRSRGMIDAGVLAAMKPTAFLINIARGPVVDEAALIAALKNKTIAGAGLDVFTHEPLTPDSPLWAMDNVMVTPRIGGMSDRYAEQIFPLIVHNLRAWATGQPDSMRNIVR